MKNFLKSAEICLKGIYKLHHEWEKVFQNNGKYNIDRNVFIFTLFMNKLYSTKIEIIYLAE